MRRTVCLLVLGCAAACSDLEHAAPPAMSPDGGSCDCRSFGGPCDNYGCDDAGSCVYIGSQDAGTNCDDFNPCSYADQCDGTGGCQGTFYSCPSNDNCNTYQCLGDGGCSHLFNSGSCSDPATCSQGACNAGTCGQLQSYCPSPEECQVRVTCNGSGGCDQTPKPDGTTCDAGFLDRCNYYTCSGGYCQQPTFKCGQPPECHNVTCDFSTGNCSFPAGPDNLDCDAGNECLTHTTCFNGTCTGPDAPAGTPCTAVGGRPGACNRGVCQPDGGTPGSDGGNTGSDAGTRDGGSDAGSDGGSDAGDGGTGSQVENPFGCGCGAGPGAGAFAVLALVAALRARHGSGQRRRQAWGGSSTGGTRA